jgi:adenylylsulfate kinase-like enzyme
MYKRALAGEISGFTGVDDPYEEPEDPELVLDTDRETVEESTRKVVSKLEELGYVSPG